MGVSGGPAGNAVLTAWLGLVLLLLIAGQLLTLLGVRQHMTWHIAIGLLLVPTSLAKIGSTSWRAARYYTGHAAYQVAGPPPLLLRILGPAVVVTTLLLLGTGLTLIAVGEQTGQSELLAVGGFRVSYVTLHQVAFFAWAAFTGLHILGRLVPAWQLTFSRRGVSGRPLRIAALLLTAVVAAGASVWVTGSEHSWRTDEHRFDRSDGFRH